MNFSNCEVKIENENVDNMFQLIKGDRRRRNEWIFDFFTRLTSESTTTLDLIDKISFGKKLLIEKGLVKDLEGTLRWDNNKKSRCRNFFFKNKNKNKLKLQILPKYSRATVSLGAEIDKSGKPNLYSRINHSFLLGFPCLANFSLNLREFKQPDFEFNIDSFKNQLKNLSVDKSLTLHTKKLIISISDKYKEYISKLKLSFYNSSFEIGLNEQIQGDSNTKSNSCFYTQMKYQIEQLFFNDKTKYRIETLFYLPLIKSKLSAAFSVSNILKTKVYDYNCFFVDFIIKANSSLTYNNPAVSLANFNTFRRKLPVRGYNINEENFDEFSVVELKKGINLINCSLESGISNLGQFFNKHVSYNPHEMVDEILQKMSVFSYFDFAKLFPAKQSIKASLGIAVKYKLKPFTTIELGLAHTLNQDQMYKSNKYYFAFHTN